MNLGLSGKVALVTGASRGIGLAIAKELVAEGCQVILNARQDADLSVATAVVGAAVTAFAADVSETAGAVSLAQFVRQKFGRLDILVCNVGSGKSVSPGDESREEWERVFAVNLHATTGVIEACRDLLWASRGSVTCVSSICGVETIPGAPLTYAAAKAALGAYVHGLARAWGGRGVRVNAVAPGNISFPGSVWETKIRDNPSAVREMLEKEVPLNRFGTLDEVAACAVFLCSPRASFVTGDIFVVDGGQTRSL